MYLGVTAYLSFGGNIAQMLNSQREVRGCRASDVVDSVLVPFRKPFIIGGLIQQLQSNNVFDASELFRKKSESQCG
jgi:hypothetical protein